MKILEAQSAVLSNVEVLSHLQEVDTRYAAHPEYLVAANRRERKASNKDGGKLRGLHSIVHDAISYLSTTPTLPSSNSSHGLRAGILDPEMVGQLVQGLARYPTLTKGEKLMIVNLRPADTDALEVIVEEAEVRLSEAELSEIVALVRDVLSG